MKPKLQVTLKTCSRCRVEKNIKEFNKLKRSKDKHDYQCRSCKKIVNAKRVSTEHTKAVAKAYRQSEAGKAKIRKNHAIDKKRNRVKYDARVKFGVQIYRKNILKQPCVVCWKKEAQAHHDDYTKPLEVMWLCLKHHIQLHRSQNEAYKTYGNILPVNGL